jgi:hypothetical protein
LATIEEAKVVIIPAGKTGGAHKNHQTHSGAWGRRAGIMSIKVRWLPTIVISKGLVHDFRQPINMQNVRACTVCAENQIIKFNFFLLKKLCSGSTALPAKSKFAPNNFPALFG